MAKIIPKNFTKLYGDKFEEAHSLYTGGMIYEEISKKLTIPIEVVMNIADINNWRTEREHYYMINLRDETERLKEVVQQRELSITEQCLEAADILSRKIINVAIQADTPKDISAVANGLKQLSSIMSDINGVAKKITIILNNTVQHEPIKADVGAINVIAQPLPDDPFAEPML